MSQENYEQLLAVLLDEELPPGAAAQLQAGLRKHPQLQRELRRQLILWEVWSQHVAEERSADSFVEAWKTRARTAGDSERFVKSVSERLGSPLSTWKYRAAFWKRWRPLQVAFAVLALAAVAMAGWWTQQQIFKAMARPEMIQLPEPSADGTVTITGEGVCVLCGLHEVNHPGPALRLRKGKATRIVYLDFPSFFKNSMALHRFFEGGGTVNATGVLTETNGRTVLKTQFIEVNGQKIP